MDWLLLMQALLIGVFCYLGSVSSPWLLGVTGGYYVIGRPLVAGLIIGIILGDIQTGIIMGVAVQAAFIATISTGGTQNQEITYAAYGGIALGILAGADVGVVVTLSIAIGALGLILHNFMMVENSFWNDRAMCAAELGDTRGVFMNNVVFPQSINFLLRVVPIALAIYFGEAFVTQMLAVIPVKVINIMNVLGGLLPALGIALLLNLVLKNKWQLLFFLVGFVFIVFGVKNMIALTVVAGVIAYFIFLIESNRDGGQFVEKDEVI
ncbi:PTS sugar transporter subunit IIC [Listeria booriae]|uniref:PTS sugar transporter subunit IIC n=1 Tax=Listeria booriae TaxID=1552123 RepID=A0A7X1CCI1_9LIST|nr:PTS sugar transporter subunit IIC [Listeria booriae]MBC1492425.1 PTS sugar transporter subunit IIC [Listeria booriae]MBC1504070.1 PTS sugar transporter subunit IIC [Listeria booriae]MBC1524281.1 PTS sugar transporter subunit IIC [Listeria booriae]MBC1531096.1 PTS sugar transporter subunit IIC [Listeria booriae]MBC6135240.1 PTS sugar transporter subunit IIC [Listeria booriae]